MALERILEQQPATRSRKAKISKDIQKAITENFATSGAAGFMRVLSELMDSYGVVNLAKETGRQGHPLAVHARRQTAQIGYPPENTFRTRHQSPVQL